jgi:hypothetical protein
LRIANARYNLFRNPCGLGKKLYQRRHLCLAGVLLGKQGTAHYLGDHSKDTHVTQKKNPSDSHMRDRRIRRVLMLEGAADVVVLLAKAVVGLSTGSLAVLGDAVHSLTDLANNVVALVVIRLAYYTMAHIPYQFQTLSRRLESH